jgi:sterol desaturase/sphingolipid hydroxylase (fatty acid hydroxylase superfamily)
VEAGVELAALLIAGILALVAGAELLLGRFPHGGASSRKDRVMDLGSALVVPGVIIPGVLFSSGALVEALWPGSRGGLSHWPAWAMLLALLIGDDMSQYWWHRLSHSSWLYPLHRAHHSAGYLSVSVTWRNNLIYYVMMPGLWISGALLWLGFSPVYYAYGVCKMLVIMGAHSSAPWDARLYRVPALHPLMWVLERLISTPATHAAHHGLHEADGVTHYRGNYGNFLFLWDVIFGTARITRRRPAAFGIEDLPPAGLIEEFVWPFGGAARSPSRSA